MLLKKHLNLKKLSVLLFSLSFSRSLSISPVFPPLESIARHDVHHPAPRQVLARLRDVPLQAGVGLWHVPERRDAEEQGEEGVETEAEERDHRELFFVFVFVFVVVVVGKGA